MPRKITNELFVKSITDYERILEKDYLLRLEEADDKEYASNYYQNMLFSQNEMVPYPSVMFHELEYTFQHHSKLNGLNKAYEKSMEFMEGIRSIANEALENAKSYLNGNSQIKLHGWYLDQLENDNRKLSELVEIEERIAKLTDENLSGALSIHLAGQRLYEKHNDSEEQALGKVENSKGQFTQNERTLALYILLESLGFRQGLNEDRTTLAALYHLIMDKNFNDSTKIKNSNIYKALGSVPDVVNDPSKLSKYLQNIRPIFEKANMENALKLIAEKIKSSK
jgi:hypothetical protein